MIKLEDFRKIDLRVARVVGAERVEGSEKLLRLEIDLGDEFQIESGNGKRQIVAGIGKFYTPEEIINKEIIVVANLEPKKLMGLESQGMLLAADVDGRPVVLKPDEEVLLGAKIF